MGHYGDTGQDDHFLIRLCKPILMDTTEDKAPKVGCNLLTLPSCANISQRTPEILESNSTASLSKVQDIALSLKEPKPSCTHHADMCNSELCHKWIALLTLEKACLSGTERKPNDFFKEKLQEIGGLHAVIEVFVNCHSYMEGWLKNDSPSIWEMEKEMVRSIIVLLKCLKIMENATFLSKENQGYMLGLKAKLDSMENIIPFTELVITAISILSGLYFRNNSPTASNDEMSCNEHASEKSFHVYQSGLLVSSSHSIDMSSSLPTSSSEIDTCTMKTIHNSSTQLNETCTFSYDSRKDPGVTQRSFIYEDSIFDLSEKSQNPFAFSCGFSKGTGLNKKGSSLLVDCLITAVKVLKNLAKENPDGCQQIANHYYSLSSSLSPFSERNENKLSNELSAHEMDLNEAILGLLPNLLKKDDLIRQQPEHFEEVNHKYVNLQTSTEKEPSYGTTNIIRLLDEGFIFAVDSRLTNNQKQVLTDNATKFRLITPKVASLMSGEFGVATTVWDRLSDWVRDRQIQGLSEPSVFRIACHARDYMTSLASCHSCTLVIAGYQYKDNNSLVPYIYKVEYTPIKGAHIEKQGKITVVGSGEIYAKNILDRVCTENMTVKNAIDAVNWAMLEASLLDSCTGGVCRVYFLSMRCQSLPAYHTCEMYLSKFEAYHTMNKRSIYVFCPELADRVDTYLEQEFSKYGFLRCVHSLGKMRAINFHQGECEFHRVEFEAEDSVDYAYRGSIVERDHYRRIYIDGLNGNSFYIIFCIASQQELERFRGQLIIK